MPNRRRSLPVRNRSGYLLFEVLLSMAILSGGLILVSRSFLASLAATRLVESHTQAVMLLERKLAEVETGEIDLPTPRNADLNGEEGSFRWEIRPKTLDPTAGTAIPYGEVEVKVVWTERGKEHEVVASLGVLQ